MRSCQRGDHDGRSYSSSPSDRPSDGSGPPAAYPKSDWRRMSASTEHTSAMSSAVSATLLVRSFVSLGNQQLQLNALNAETLLDAKAHPENHRDLIVRVWGWSGYFCELAPEYQDHVISRHLFAGV